MLPPIFKGVTMLHKPGVTESLAQNVVAARWEDIPSAVRHQAKRSLHEFLCRRADRMPHRDGRDRARLARDVLRRQAGDVIGRRERIDALSAAFLNAAGANVLDFCDTHVRP
jgi:2-methylcitrate dehydratase PrpD